MKQVSERVMRNGAGYIKSDPYSKTRRQCNVILEPFNHQGNAQGSSESITPRNTQAEVGLPVSDTLADKLMQTTSTVHSNSAIYVIGVSNKGLK